ncbi:MAG: RNA 2',3'-cyclic phosphodiesterase [Candidatus Omnitrophota bacterium]
MKGKTPNGTNKIRSFIALELSDEARAELSRIEGILEKAGANVKWVKPESIHLTLKFLGYVTEEKVASITKRLERIASECAPFDVTLSNIGVFPGWGYPRVIWIGTEEGSDKVKDLAKLVEEAMAEEGFEKEKRPFKSHLTVGRVRSGKNKDRLKEEAQSIKVKPASSHIKRIVLFKSDLSPKGAVYTPLFTANFSA